MKKNIGIILLFSLITGSISAKPELVSEKQNQENYPEYFYEKIRTVQKKVQVKFYLESVKWDFKVDTYFKNFDELKVEKYWKLYAFYEKSFIAGSPVITAYKTLGRKGIRQSDIEKQMDSIKAMDHIELSGSERSYYQYLLFNLIGDDFAKYWHAGYTSYDLIFSRKQLSKLLHSEEMQDSIKNKIRQVDPLPHYAIQDGSVLISLKMFNDWEGLHERTYKIMTTFPHKIEMLKDTILVNYKSQIRY